jgi:hypothetical protein
MAGRERKEKVQLHNELGVVIGTNEGRDDISTSINNGIPVPVLVPIYGELVRNRSPTDSPSCVCACSVVGSAEAGMVFHGGRRCMSR